MMSPFLAQSVASELKTDLVVVGGFASDVCAMYQAVVSKILQVSKSG